MPHLTNLQFLNAQSFQNFELEGTVQSKEDNGALIGVTLELFEVSESVFEQAKDNQSRQISNRNSLELSQNSRIKATSTDANGRFTLDDIPSGAYVLVVRYVGYEELRIPIKIPEELPNRLRLFLNPDVVEFGEIQVQASSFQDSTSTQTSVQRISSTQVQSLAGGQGNVFNLLKVVPSVTSTSDYSSQLIVRGGEANQNLFVLDDIEIYSPYQANGVGSLFNPNVIRDMDFYAGAFPASFGDRLSSVLVINTTTGNPTKALETQLEVDATVAALTMKGAIPFWESSWIVSGRKTYFDSFANTFAQRVVTQNDIAFPDFNDLTAKLELRPGTGHTVSITGLLSDDVIDWIAREDQFGELESDRENFSGDQSSSNQALGLRWTYSPAPFFQTHLYTNYYKNTGDNGIAGDFRPGVVPGTGFLWESPVSDTDSIVIDYDQQYLFEKYTAGTRLFFTLPRHELEIGGGYDQLVNNLAINLGLNDLGEAMFATFETASPMLEAFGDTLNSKATTDRYYAYAQYRFELFKERLFVQSGMRYVEYGINNEAYLLPRFGISFLPAKGLTFRLGGGTYVQSPGFEKLIEPDNIFNVSKFKQVDGLESEQSQQVVLGVTKIIGSDWQIEVEGYVKEYQKLITREYRNLLILEDIFNPTTNAGNTMLNPNNYYFELQRQWKLTDTPVNNGTGRSEGVEILVQKFPSVNQAWSGWFSYIWAKSERTEEINGEPFTYPFDYDRRHTMNLIGNYKVSATWDLSFTWRYGTGLPYTEPIGLDPMNFIWRGDAFFISDPETGNIQLNPDFGELYNVNKQRYPAYNRIDIRAQYSGEFSGLKYNFYVDFVNMFNSQNVQSYKYVLYLVDPNVPGTPDFLRKSSWVELKREPVFMYPFIPSLGVKLRF
jgi:hypothetical protein